MSVITANSNVCITRNDYREIVDEQRTKLILTLLTLTGQSSL